MEVKVLKYFLTVVREENLSKAADALYITQPTLSRQMTALEEELGTQLFVRGKKLALTEAGMLLRRRAEEVVDMVDKMEREFSEPQDSIGGVISIGTGGLRSFQTLPEIMESFKKKYPKIRYEVYTNSAEHLKERLDKGLLDFALLLEPVDMEKYEYIRITCKERWGILTRTNSELAKKEYVTKEDLRGRQIITAARQSVQKELANWFGDDFNSLEVFATYNLITNAAALVKDGIANALTIEGAVNLYDKDIMTFRPLFPELEHTSVLAWKKFQPIGKAASKFLEYIKSALKA